MRLAQLGKLSLSGHLQLSVGAGVSVPRPRRPAPSAFLDSALGPGWIEHRDSNGAISRMPDPRWTREQHLTAIKARARAAEEVVAEIRSQIIDLLLASNPLGAYAELWMFESMARARLEANFVWGLEAAIEFVGGLVTSLDPALVMDRVETRVAPEVTLSLSSLAHRLAVAEKEALMAGDLERLDDQTPIRVLLKGELSFDRMRGYEQHLAHIAREVFARIDRIAQREMGFVPSSIIAVIEAMDTMRADEVRLADEECASVADSLLRQGKSGDPNLNRSLTSMFLQRGAAKVRDDLADRISGMTGVASNEIDLMLDAISTPLGSQELTRMSEKNRLTNFPVIRLTGGRYIWCKPGDFLHSLLEWFDELCAQRNLQRLRTSFLRARDRAAEDLVTKVFTSTCSGSPVYPKAEYQREDGEWVEADLVVRTPDTAVVVEVKAHSVTPQGRAAAPRRVDRVVRDLLQAPLEQSAKAKEALLAGRPWRVRGSTIEIGHVAEVVRIVVTFELADPLATFVHKVADAEADAWVVSMSSLLMVTDILRTTEEIFAYARCRAEMNREGSPLVLMESDALAAYLRNREGPWRKQEGVGFVLGYQSDELNKYFTAARIAMRVRDFPVPPRPSAGVPEQVLEALQQIGTQDARVWRQAVLSVMDIKPKEWRKLERALTQARVPRRQRRAVALLASKGLRLGDGLTVRIGAGPAAAYDPTKGSVDLQLPMAS